MNRETGTIVRVMLDRGFGFLRRSNSRDLFFHVRDLSRDLPFDETLIERRVSFGVTETDKGPRASDVQPA